MCANSMCSMAATLLCQPWLRLIPLLGRSSRPAIVYFRVAVHSLLLPAAPASPSTAALSRVTTLQ